MSTTVGATTLPAAASEWLKLRTVRSTWWFVGTAAALVVLSVGLATDNGDPATVQSMAGAQPAVSNFLQFVLGAWGVLAVTTEFANRSITVTLAGTPSRSRVMLAKTGVVAIAVFVVALAVLAGGVAVSAVRFDELGALTAQHGERLVAMAAYVAGIALIGLGLGAAVRRTAGTLTILVLLVLMVPELLGLLAGRFDAEWLARVADHTPGPVGHRLMGGEWEWGAVLLAWVVAAVAGGIVALRARDV
jgi:ABC-2 type transport system permease protein